MDIDVIGAGFNSAGTTTGVALAPRALRSAALIEGLRSRHRVTDSGDITFSLPSSTRSPDSGLLAEESLVSMIAGVDRAIAEAWRQRRLPLLLGGDCPVFIGALAAGRKAFGDMGLLFVDGHEDAWPPATSPTGEAADCELGLALGVTTATLPGELTAILPLLRPEATAVLGPRDVEELSEFAVASLRDTVWFRSGEELSGRAHEDSAQALYHVSNASKRFWLHVDLDVLSTGAMSAVDYPQSGTRNPAVSRGAISARSPPLPWPIPHVGGGRWWSTTPTWTAIEPTRTGSSTTSRSRRRPATASRPSRLSPGSATPSQNDAARP